MPTNAKILVAAPDPAFRRSLAFVLEAEGCHVDMADRLCDLDGLPARYACLVVDHRVIASGPDGAPGLAGLQMPVVVLASNPQEMASRGFVRVVVKPLLGQNLIDAVRHAVMKYPPAPCR